MRTARTLPCRSCICANKSSQSLQARLSVEMTGPDIFTSPSMFDPEMSQHCGDGSRTFLANQTKPVSRSQPFGNGVLVRLIKFCIRLFCRHVKASSWKRDFGLRQVVPSAVLSGVYKLHNLTDAQERGLTIFWAHNLVPLTDWIKSTQPSSGSQM